MNTNNKEYNYDENNIGIYLNSVKESVVIKKGEDSFWIASCVDLKGCHSQGATMQEAIKNIEDAIKEYKEAMASNPISTTKINIFSLDTNNSVQASWG